ncbi:hypothetical protein ElyMa_006544000 [Elysia marginata]|uniref:C-type lectin domain-containing protein n=1 Tax=Elysia marginata TaxID=1093978 RepID=A0AAV4I939_9GAST|nr:hypothetical protein ElyMa_006544000 [Elysia marginata]
MTTPITSLEQTCRLLVFGIFSLFFIITSWPGSGAVTFDLAIVEEKLDVQDGTQRCRDAGYDGLASLPTPEAFSFAKKFAYDFWKNDGGIYIGLTFLPGERHIWNDGTPASSDTPFGLNDPRDSTSIPLYGRITRVGKIRMFSGTQYRTSLCGRYKKCKFFYRVF